MYVKELWRYPVKSLAGERLKEISIDACGLAGDRLVHVRRQSGEMVTSRTHPNLLALKGTLDEGGRARVNGFEWDSTEALAVVRSAAGREVGLAYCAGPERFDVLPLSVATDGAIQHLNIDGRRLRPNIILGGIDDLAERSWPGRHLKIGALQIFAQRLRPRCVMTTYDPDTRVQDIGVLKRISQELGGVMSLDCSVTGTGTLHEGDIVTLIE